jgi:hypothetical protein
MNACVLPVFIILTFIKKKSGKEKRYAAWRGLATILKNERGCDVERERKVKTFLEHQ